MPSLSTVYKEFPVTGGAGGVSGYGSTFHFLDWHNDIIAPGAWLLDIPRFLSKGFVGGIGHDHKKPIGKPMRVYEDSRGLYMDASFDASDEAQHARQKIKDGIIKLFSVGVVPLQARQLNEKQIYEYWAKAGWQPGEEEKMRASDPSGATLIKRARILEISPVAIAANDHAEIITYKSFNSSDVDELRSRVEALEAKFKAMNSVPPEDEDEIEKLLTSFENFLGDR